MSLQVRNQTSGILERVAGFNDTDSILSPSSQNPISNRAVYAALAQKIDKTVTDLINYYDKSQVYNKPEVRALIGAINTLTIEVVSQLPTQDISTTTIYFVGPAAGTNNYDEYVYVGGNWVQIGDTTIDLSNYVTSASLTTVLQDYYTKSQADALFDNYYDKNTVDDLLDLKQNTLDFDNTPIAGSQNPVTSAGIKTALDNILISGNGGSIIKVHHLAGAAAAGNTVTASKGSYSVSSTFDTSGDAIIIGFGEIGDITITATNGSETGSTMLNIPSFSNYSVNIAYGLDYASWLIAGGVDPSYYESLDEVLEDEEVVRRLMTLHASVDYLASITNANDEMAIAVLNNDICAKWINLRDYALDTLYANEYAKAIMDEADKYGYGEWALVGQVPTMTSNTAPYGEVIVSSIHGTGYEAWRVFDKNPLNTEWASSKDVSSAYIGYKFTEPVNIRQVSCYLRYNDTNSIYKVQYSDDGATWSDTIEDSSFETVLADTVTVDLDDNGSHLYWRLQSISRSGSFYYVAELQFYAWQPKGNVPIMTSNTAPYGTASASTEYSATYTAFNAFNNIISGQNAWRSNTSDTVRYIAYKFTNPICVKGLKWLGSIDSGDYFFDVDAYIEYSNDGTTWATADTIAMAGTDGKKLNFNNIDADTYALYWRVRLSDYNRGASASTRSNCCFMYLQFYGREMKVSVPAMTSNTAPYGETFGNPAAYSSTYDFYRAFDKNSSTQAAYINGAAQGYFGYDFGRKVAIKYAAIYQTQGTRPTTIIYSDDKVNWTDACPVYSHAANTTAFIKANDDAGEHRYWALRIVNNNNANTAYMDFYGFDYTERDWDTEHPMTYLYDHGVEPTDVITSVANASGNAFIKEPSRLTINKTTTSAWNAMYPANQIDVTDYTLARAVSTDGTGINGVASLATCSNLSTGATDSYKVMATNLAPYHQYNNMASINTSRWITIGFSTNVTGNIAISEWWLEQ